MPAVSVIVVNLDRRDLLRACLESLEKQRGIDFDVIVIDNGSTDRSADMVREEFASGARLPVRLIVNAENRGFCGANNQGFAASTAPFFALLNNDAEAEPGWLTALYRACSNAGDVGMAASKILAYGDPARIDKAGHLIYLDGQNRGRGTGELDRGQYDRPEEVLFPDGCAAMYRRAMIESIGGFDEDFFAYGDDAELGLRARIAGWRCLYAPDAVVRHHRGATLGVASPQRLQLIERNRLLLAAKLFPWSLLWLNPAFYLTRIGAGLWAALRGRGEISRFPGIRGKLRAATALIRGDLSALMLLPKMLAKRRRLRKIRRLSSRELRRLILRHRIRLRTLMEQAV